MKIMHFLIVVIIFSAFAFAAPALVNGKKGSLSYEGKNYKTVKIGKQEWMAENLNYKSKNGKGKNICAGCEDFGRLYTWNSAMDIKQEVKEDYGMESRTEDRPISKKHQGICPTGWHIPTVEDVKELLTYISVKSLKDAGNWQDSYLEAIQGDLNEFIFPRDGGRSQRVIQNMWFYGVSLCEPGYWAYDGDGNEQCTNRFGLNIKSSGSGEYRELDKCSEWSSETDLYTGKRICCSEGCAGDYFVMWLAEEKKFCYDKVIKGRHVCEYEPKAALFWFGQGFGGGLLQEIDWRYKNSYASVRCLKN